MTPDASVATESRRRPRHAPEETEREILDAAEQLLREHPFREVTVDAVMRRTGLKRPAFYAHFRDRHHLALRVVQRIGEDLRAMTDRWLTGNRPEHDVRTALEGTIAVFVEHGPVLRAITDAAGSDAEVEQTYRAFVQEFVDASARRIREDVRAGRIVAEIDVEQTATALVWLVERYLLEAFGRSRQTDPAKVLDVLERIWMATLYSPAAP